MSEPVAFQFKPIKVPIGQPFTVRLPPRVYCARLGGLHFDTDLAFLLPSAMKSIGQLRQLYAQNPGMSVLVTGHTDTVGGPAHNFDLSIDRAESVAAFLKDDVDAWLAFYQPGKKSKLWGTTQDQQMLSALGQPDVRSYQQSKGLTADGVAGPDTRRALITDYMGLDGTTLPDADALVTHGCGESHLLKPTGPNVDEPENRRVEIFLFEGPVDPPPRAPCDNCPEYPQWVARTTQWLDLDADTGWLDVMVFDGGGNPVSGARVAISGPASSDAVTGSGGVARFPDLAPGQYQVTAGAAGAADVRFAVEVTTGQAPAAAPAVTPPGAPPTPLPANSQLQRESFVGGPDGDPAPPPGPPQGSGSQAGVNLGVAILWRGWGVLLHEFPEDLKESGREGKGAGGAQPWARSTLNATLAYAPNHLPALGAPASAPYQMPVLPDTSRAPDGFSAVIGTSHPDVTNTFEIHSDAGHTAPIVWVMDHTEPITVDTPAPVERMLMGRARFSLWGGVGELVDPNSTGKPMVLPAGVIDDISLLTTVQNDLEMKPVLDVGIIGARSPKIFQDGIKKAHASNVQLFAGFGLVDRGQSRIVRFDAWLDELSKLPQAAMNARADDFAEKLVGFIDGLSGSERFDGLSFDIESCGLFTGSPLSNATQTQIDALRPVVRRFYKTVADKLAVDNRACAITVGGMMSDDSALEAGIPEVPSFKRQAALAAKLQTYDLPKAAKNIVIRPMAYDNAGGTLDRDPTPEEAANGSAKQKIAAFNSDDGQLHWHEAMTRFALETKKLHPGQYQLGMKIFTPMKNNVSTGQGGNVPETSRQLARCKLLRPYRAGLVLFAMGSQPNFDHLQQLNAQLNAGFDGKTPLPPARIGQPVQVPLDAQAARRIGVK